MRADEDVHNEAFVKVILLIFVFEDSWDISCKSHQIHEKFTQWRVFRRVRPYERLYAAQEVRERVGLMQEEVHEVIL